MSRNPVSYIAREFADRFPGVRRYGRLWLERELAIIQEKGGWSDGELLARVRQFSHYRRDLTPRDLLRPLPREAPPPLAARAPITGVPPASEEWRRRVLWIFEPYEMEEE